MIYHLYLIVFFFLLSIIFQRTKPLAPVGPKYFYKLIFTPFLVTLLSLSLSLQFTSVEASKTPADIAIGLVLLHCLIAVILAVPGFREENDDKRDKTIGIVVAHLFVSIVTTGITMFAVLREGLAFMGITTVFGFGPTTFILITTLGSKNFSSIFAYSEDSIPYRSIIVSLLFLVVLSFFYRWDLRLGKIVSHLIF